MKKRFLRATTIVALAVAFTAPLAARAMAQDGNTDGIPEWLVNHMTDMTRDGGTWVADNSMFENSQEPFDAYGMEWKWGVGRSSITGRLFGLKDGEEIGLFWQFRLFWHPGERRAILTQFGGGGAFGTGSLWETGTRSTEADQTYYNLDGTTFRVRHTDTLDGDSRETRSFNFVDEVWEARRSYVWVRQAG